MTQKSTNPKDRIGCTKVPLSMIPLSAQIQAALAHFDGSLKYGVYNWRRETVAASIYVDAALRHINKWFHGEECDADSGIHHLGHALACLNIVIDAQSYGNLVDDRPPADCSPADIDAARNDVLRLIKLRGKEVPSTPPITDEPGSMEPGLIHGLNQWLEDHPPAECCPDVPVSEAKHVPMEHDDQWDNF